MNPSYAGPALPNFQHYGISFDRTSGEGIRLAGRPGGSATYISVAELRVFGEDAGPLPIQLVSFTGSDSSGVAVLRWTTASERNNFGFYVERDGVLLLNSFVHGHGTSNEVHTYSYRDASSGGRFIRRYRLKQLDLDGAVWWSRPVTLSIIHGAVQPSTQ